MKTTDSAQLQRLRRLGVRVAIDDFGTGYSGLAYLRTLPVDVIKIDQSFVAELVTDAAASAVLVAIVPPRPRARPRGHRRGSRITGAGRAPRVTRLRLHPGLLLRGRGARRRVTGHRPPRSRATGALHVGGIDRSRASLRPPALRAAQSCSSLFVRPLLDQKLSVRPRRKRSGFSPSASRSVSNHSRLRCRIFPAGRSSVYSLRACST